MKMPSPLIIIAVLSALLSLAFLVITFAVIRKRKIFAAAVSFMILLLMLSLSALFGTVSMAIQGYQALAKEELAAIIKVLPIGKQMFMAHFSLPDGSEKAFFLTGDQLFVDAHILKWKRAANMFGLHTSYELGRVGGRYKDLNDETAKARTVYSLSKDKPVNMFDLRQRFAMLNPLLDAEYGSATFINSTSMEEFRVMVSTTGLLIRKSEKETGAAAGPERAGRNR